MALGTVLVIRTVLGPATAGRPVAPDGASPAAAPARALATGPTCGVQPSLIGTVAVPSESVNDRSSERGSHLSEPGSTMPPSR